jgi:pyruvate,orthophosphate dikinase
MAKKYVYLFSEGNAAMRDLLGGKGANLAEMTGLNLPVPQGFTVTTEACNRYYQDGEIIADDIMAQIFEYLAKAEEINAKKFGDSENPLLVSVRSGARASMPGMMDTILNLGLNDVAVKGIAKLTNNERFAYDSYRRFIQMFSDVVMGIAKAKFEAILDDVKESKGVKMDTELTAEDLKTVVQRYKALYVVEMGCEFPQDPKVQLIEAIKAVFRSWDNPRAIVYRRLNDIPGDWGTAVNVQAMVFGNMGNDPARAWRSRATLHRREEALR